MTATTATSPAVDDERADLLAELAAARAALITTTRGLSDEQAAARPTISALCLGGLLKHVTNVERSWMRFVLEGPSAMTLELPDGVTWDDFMAGTAREYPQWAIDRQQEFQVLPGETLAGIVESYGQAAAETERIVTALPGLSATQPLPEAPWHEPGGRHSARRVLIHIIAETTQHAGHADILRETLDGRSA
ncbi:DinB family protein [Saccharopolyspora sp. NFXS83]|uniref:DinB family protein n=1 Tax=Saccharopolyspora sp. NFXS83 TaxID=2993560 RepID=UPI00224B0B60|nr:DinB family protein [Saccharopolyspora sp. NFXS83]MCX2731455.1 DinB family protein [Saccharopolyspora sp. NFXS83]